MLQLLLVALAFLGQPPHTSPSPHRTGFDLDMVPEVLSGSQVANLRRLDGRVVRCRARKVLEGPPERKGKWVILEELPQEAAVAPQGDPYGFARLLNAFRIRPGLWNCGDVDSVFSG